MKNEIKKIEIVGAGASGLFLTHALLKRGFKVSVFEKEEKVGGVVQTLEAPWGKIETGANSFMNSSELEALAEDLNVELMSANRDSKRKFIFSKGKLNEVGIFSFGIVRPIVLLFNYYFFKEKIKPREMESVYHYSNRLFGKKISAHVIFPALQGIYAGDPKELSSSIIFGKFFEQKLKKQKTKYERTVAPLGGMGYFFQALYLKCVEMGAEFHFSKDCKENIKDKETIRIYTGNPYSMSASLQSLKNLSKDESENVNALKEFLEGLDVLPVVTATLFFNEPPRKIKPSFGVLFEQGEKFKSLGVLFNTWIFKNRSIVHSETWIAGGALHRKEVQLSDDEILNLILEDREKCFQDETKPKFSLVSKWNKAFPHYNLTLEKKLNEFKSTLENNELKFRLFGTSLGELGIGRLIQSADYFSDQLLSQNDVNQIKKDNP